MSKSLSDAFSERDDDGPGPDLSGWLAPGEQIPTGISAASTEPLLSATPQASEESNASDGFIPSPSEQHLTGAPYRTWQYIAAWVAIAVAALAAGSALFVAPPSATWATKAPVLALAALATVVAATSLSRMWPYLRPRARIVPLVIVSALVALFVLGAVSQRVIDGQPILHGSVRDQAAAETDELHASLNQAADDAEIATLDDSQILAQLPAIEATITRRLKAASDRAASRPVEGFAQASAEATKVDQSVAALLRARVAAAEQPTEGRRADLTAAIDDVRRNFSSARSSLAAAAERASVPAPASVVRLWTQSNGARTPVGDRP